MVFNTVDEGIVFDFPKIRSREQTQAMTMVCPACVFEHSLENLNGADKTVLDQDGRDFVNLSRAFTIKETRQMVKIENYLPVMAVIQLNEFGMVPITSTREHQLEDHTEPEEIVENVFQAEISVWNTLKEIRRHFRRSHTNYRYANMADDPIERSLKEAAARVIQAYALESISQLPQTRRSLVEHIFSCFKALKVSSLCLFETLLKIT